jgi:hypothetical protein
MRSIDRLDPGRHRHMAMYIDDVLRRRPRLDELVRCAFEPDVRVNRQGTPAPPGVNAPAPTSPVDETAGLGDRR